MTKLNYDEWKEKYCAKITQEQLDHIKNLHGIENPKGLIEQYFLESYEKFYIGGLFKIIKDPEVDKPIT